VFPVNIGYHFIQTKAGAANGQFSGIGADESNVCVKVEAIQPMGLLITNGQFVCMHGDTRTAVVVDETVTVHRVLRFSPETDLELNAEFVPQRVAWHRSSMKH
jgi:hypothetical protein